MNSSAKTTTALAADSFVAPQKNLRLAIGLFVVGLIVFPLIAPAFWVYFLAILGINIVAAHGLNITMGYTGLLSLGHAAFMGVGAYTAALAQIHFSVPFWLGIPLAGFTTALVGIGFGVTSRKVVRLFPEQFRLEFVPVLHRLQGRLAAQG